MLLLAAAAAPAGCTSERSAAKTGQAQPDSLLQLISPPTPAEAVAWAADPYDADKRYRGILLLANAPWGGERVYLELYRAAIKDGDPAVRSAAVRGLALHGEPEDVPLILGQLSDPDRLLRWECARALQRIHNPVAVTDLIKRADADVEPEAEVRAAIASALGQYPESRVLEALVDALSDRDLAVNVAARDSLRVLTGQDFVYNLRAWVAWRKETADPFAGKGQYIYPVFYRDPTWLEAITPFYTPPNEVAAAPAGLGPPRPKPPPSPPPESPLDKTDSPGEMNG